MKHFFTLFLLFLCSFSFSQNGGIFSENSHLRLEFLGFFGSSVVVKTTNKIDCGATIRVQWGGLHREKFVLPLSSDTFHLTPQQQRIIRAHSSPLCGGNSGNVEIDVPFVVSVKFEYLKLQKNDDGTYNLRFKVSNSENIQKFNIQLSKDGINYKNIEIVIPDKLKPNKVYDLNIKL